MLKLLKAVSLLALLSGCATTPVPLSEATAVPADRQFLFAIPVGGTAPIVITRDIGMLGTGCATRVTVDGKLAALVRSGEKVTLNIPLGTAVLGAEPDGICGGGLVEIEAKPQGTDPILFRIAAEEGGIRLFRTARR
ncbi:MAG: hypothetical protein Q7K57_57530 [Burkholderiaceae bacterium]|nr:hypothetical protein [Polaromonas sp.]MDO8778171.1 hypothetical protein [Burkholderiaceae bacterium]